MGKTKGKLNRKLLKITMGPLFLSGTAVLLITYFSFQFTMQNEVQSGLRNVAVVTQRMMDHLYEGDYYLDNQDGEYTVYKGNFRLTDNDAVLREIKRDTEVDVTFFYGDVRVLTTLKAKDGTSFVGTKVSSQVAEDVLQKETDEFYNKVLVGETPYFAYYMPLYNGDGTCIGMVFAGKPANVVNAQILNALFPLLFLLIFTGVCSCIICAGFTKGIVSDITQIKAFLREIAQGNLKAQLDDHIIQRDDELGEMGRFIIHVQAFLCEMVEKDMLTRLYSRRIGEIRLRQVQEDAIKYDKSYCVALGDIDLFKKFNDTYGHDCGDRVLKEVSAIIIRNMKGRGFAVRWGGEEVLIIYENASLEDAKHYLENMRRDIIDYHLQYNEESLSITMTFGIVEGTKNQETSYSIKQADDLLYQGKMNGRNQIMAANI